MDTYIISSNNIDLIKFINGNEFELKVFDNANIKYELFNMVKNFLIKYDFEIPDNLSVITIDDFINFYNGNSMHHRSYLNNIGYINFNLIKTKQ